jgi:NAD(P)-dependent dehydrogenase (short-subunit alcohol dehydrogenase family)
MQDLVGKVAVVTGAANGIGLDIACALAKAGVHVALADIERENAEQAAADIADLGIRVVAVRLDVPDPTAGEAAARRIEAAFDNLDRYLAQRAR